MILSKEIYKDIPGYEGLYKCSNFGNVKSLDRVIYKGNNRYGLIKGKSKKQTLGKNGYLHLVLYKNNKSKTITIHKIVAITFLNHVPDNYNLIVDHIDNNPLNNNANNLQITTQRKNTSKDKIGFTSKYVGVSWNKQSGKWITHIRINGKSKHLGLYKDEFQAHLAYQNKLKQIENNINN